ncbi:hypothetical protein [Gordonia sp. SL306]|uniref:hypothetical protein n=1 Tax=Gordonia sp. SL306 TaxID=2995145 RepID=UPI00226D5D93|nr:hypothetical protein [Gordonia sp. SL306]WAC56279.1 hypothetical protein OVA31_03155 [Gordonia sp. SL306]
MSRADLAAFASTPDGVAFFGAYDRLLDRWPSGTVTVDLPGRFGSTRVTRAAPPMRHRSFCCTAAARPPWRGRRSSTISGEITT